jgi:hypothetical protein
MKVAVKNQMLFTQPSSNTHKVQIEGHGKLSKNRLDLGDPAR